MDPRDVRHVGVVGCGLMGSGIVEVLARAGADVTYVEGPTSWWLAGARPIERSVGKAVERGKLEAAECEAALGRVRGVTDLDGLDGSDLVIEAATEDVEAKLDIFRTLGDVTRARGRARLEHVVDPDRRARGRVGAAGTRDRDALLQPSAGHGAARADPRPHDVGRDVRVRPQLRDGRARQDMRAIEGPRRVHREPAAGPVPVRRGPAARRRFRDPRGHRHRDPSGSGASDGAAHADGPDRPGHHARASAKCCIAEFGEQRYVAAAAASPDGRRRAASAASPAAGSQTPERQHGPKVGYPPTRNASVEARQSKPSSDAERSPGIGPVGAASCPVASALNGADPKIRASM